MARFFWWAGTGSAFACHLPVASIEPPKERKRLLGPGDNLPGAFHFVQLGEPIRLSGIRIGAGGKRKGCRLRRQPWEHS
jgi:hypothetical protein